MLLFLSAVSTAAHAQDKPNYAYLGLEPDIVTNFVGPSAKKLGFVRVTIELMIADAGQLEIAEHHMPLLRATALEIFGQQPEQKVRSMTGREDIRLAVLKALQTHMKQETGAEIIKNVIFTKYLYDT
ncbi:flagellar basal body-associated protein FliL [Salinimonas marina]|nr:flagellar basal body-associated protein FliL [Salinimonas marina]